MHSSKMKWGNVLKCTQKSHHINGCVTYVLAVRVVKPVNEVPVRSAC